MSFQLYIVHDPSNAQNAELNFHSSHGISTASAIHSSKYSFAVHFRTADQTRAQSCVYRGQFWYRRHGSDEILRLQMLLDGEVEGERFSTLLQNAETVRLVTPGGPESAWSSKAVTELRAGDALLLYRTDAARHTGMAIKENIVER